METTFKIKATLCHILLVWFLLFTRRNVDLDMARHIQIFGLINIFAAIKVHFWLREVAR